MSILTLAARWSDTLKSFTPPLDLTDFCKRDFSQDWISARALLGGRSAYEPLRTLIESEFGPDALPTDAEVLPYNAHPPFTILLTIPFGLMGFKAAWISWNIISLICLLSSILIIFDTLMGGIRGSGPLIVTIFVATSHPFHETIWHGQVNCIFLLLITAAWAVMERWPRASGAIVASATAVKLFPGLLLVSLLVRRRRASLVAAFACLAAFSTITLFAIGYQDCRRYVLEVVPSIGSDHGAAWGNQSLSGLFHKLFGDTKGKYRPLYKNNVVEQVATLTSLAIACSITLAMASKAESRQGGRDYVAMCVFMVLLSSVAWNHYFLILIFPLAWIYARGGVKTRAAVIAISAVLWVPRWTIWKLAAPGAVHDGTFDVVGPFTVATGLAAQTHAMILTSMLIILMPTRIPSGSDRP